MEVSKLKYCKCGHEKEMHQGKSKLAFATYCRECPCSSYLNRKLPDKASYAFTIFSVLFGVFFLIALCILTIQSDPALEGKQNQTITVTLGEVHDILGLVFFFIGIYIFIISIIDPIAEISHAKKRKEFPLNDKHE